MIPLTLPRCGTIVLFFCCLLFAACAGKDGPEAPQPAAPERDFSGYSGKVAPEAEKAYAEARVLWRREAATLSAAERCSDPEQALTLLDKALALEPGYAEALARRGLAKSELGDGEGAFDDLTAAVRLAPTPENYAFRALASLRGGREKAAARDLEYSLKLNSSQYLARNYLGLLELTQGKTMQACSSFKEGCSNGDCSFLEMARKEKVCP